MLLRQEREGATAHLGPQMALLGCINDNGDQFHFLPHKQSKHLEQDTRCEPTVLSVRTRKWRLTYRYPIKGLVPQMEISKNQKGVNVLLASYTVLILRTIIWIEKEWGVGHSLTLKLRVNLQRLNCIASFECGTSRKINHGARTPPRGRAGLLQGGFLFTHLEPLALPRIHYDVVNKHQLRVFHVPALDYVPSHT